MSNLHDTLAEFVPFQRIAAAIAAVQACPDVVTRDEHHAAVKRELDWQHHWADKWQATDVERSRLTERTGTPMSAVDTVAGYPVHAVEQYAQRDNGHGVLITDWRATCGATGKEVGSRPFGLSGSARWRELCRTCWPARHATPHPAPVKVDALTQEGQRP